MLKRLKNHSSTVTAPPRTGKFIAIYNSKGGVGKTEISRNIAHKAIELRRSIILFDVDSQRDSSTLLLPVGNEINPALTDFERSRFVLVTHNFEDVRAYPERLVIADCPPQRDSLTLLESIADFWVIPVGSDVQEVQHAIEVAKQMTKPFVFVLSRWNFDVEGSNGLLEMLFAVGRIFRSVLHQDNVVVAEARARRVPVWEVDEEFGELYEDVATWILSAECSYNAEYFLDQADIDDLIDDTVQEEVTIHARRGLHRAFYE